MRGLKRPPRARSSQNVLVTAERSKLMSVSGVTNSMSKATICCFRRSRCLIRKRAASVGEARVEMRAEAETRETVVL